MKYIKDQKHRIGISILAGILACVVCFGSQRQTGILGWWGVLYPEFCFAKSVQHTEMEWQEMWEKGNVKISFWLAKAFDW